MDLTPEHDLRKLIAGFAPRRVLLIGTAAASLIESYLAEHSHCHVEAPPLSRLPAALARLGRFDLGIIAGALEQMDKAKAGQVIAALRDVHCSRILLVAPLGAGRSGQISTWELNELFGYGFVQLAMRADQASPLAFFAFDMETYKTTPDWLNAKYWAHPELFDKYWW